MKKKGFTLVEILIVVIILGILAAIVVPQFSEVAKDAEKGLENQESDPYRITEKDFGIFYVEAFSVDQNYGYGEYLDQGLEELRDRGLIIKDTFPIRWRGDQAKVLWVRTKKKN